MHAVKVEGDRGGGGGGGSREAREARERHCRATLGRTVAWAAPPFLSIAAIPASYVRGFFPQRPQERTPFSLPPSSPPPPHVKKSEEKSEEKFDATVHNSMENGREWADFLRM